MLKEFSIALPPTAKFGSNVSLQTGEMLKGIGCKKVICVFDKGVKATGLVDPIINCIKKAGIEVLTYDGVLPDPPDYTCVELAEIGKKEKIDGLVAIGGGSTIDTAKTANLLITNHDKTLDEYHMNFFSSNTPGLPMITIPTTAGTGSEVTGSSIITNTRTDLEPRLIVNQKMAIWEPATASAVFALIDPLLMLGLPAQITVSTALDALAHCLESYTTDYSNIFLDPLCIRGIELIINNLPKVLENPKDVEGRLNLSIAASIGGFTAQNAFAHMAHAVGQGMQSVWHKPHGMACGVGLQMAIEVIAEMLPNKVYLIGKAMGVDVGHLTPKEAGAQVSKEMGNFLRLIKQPTIKEQGIDKSELEKAIPYIMNEASYFLGPVKPSAEVIMEYLLRVYDEY